MDSTPDPTIIKLVGALQQALGGCLVSIYTFGASFARGPTAPNARLLVLVDHLDGPLLERLSPVSAEARKERILLRLDTPKGVLASTDVFPVFTLELIDTRVLVAGTDTLASLEVHPEHLALHCEQSLRVLHRNLLVGYLSASEDRDIAQLLRQQIRRAVYLLRAVGLVRELPLPDPPTADSIVEVVIADLLPDQGELWARLLRLARFEDAPGHDALLALFGDALQGLTRLVDAVDQLDVG